MGLKLHSAYHPGNGRIMQQHSDCSKRRKALSTLLPVVDAGWQTHVLDMVLLDCHCVISCRLHDLHRGGRGEAPSSGGVDRVDMCVSN